MSRCTPAHGEPLRPGHFRNAKAKIVANRVKARGKGDVVPEDMLRFVHEGLVLLIVRSPKGSYHCVDGICSHERVQLGGGYGMRGTVETADGRILLPPSDVPHYRTVFLVESADGGLLTLHYGEDNDGVTAILATHWQVGQTKSYLHNATSNP